METIPRRSFTKQRKQFLQENDKLYEGMELPTPNIKPSSEIIKQTHKIMMDGEKDVLAGEHRKSLVFSGYHTFATAGFIQRCLKDTIFRFHKTKKDDSIMAATNLFGNIINIHPFEDGNGRICRLILAHVLIRMKCCLF